MDAERAGTLARRAGAALAAVAVAFVVVAMVREWGNLADVVAEARLSWLLVGIALFGAAEIVYASLWPATLGVVGCPVDRRRASASFLVTQAAKFVPGGVWPAVGRVAAARQLDVPRRAVVAGLALEAGASIAAAVWIGVAAGAAARAAPWPSSFATTLLAVTLAVAGDASVLAAWMFGRRVWAGMPSVRRLPRVVSWHLLAWAAYSVAAAAVGAAYDVDALTVAGAFTLSWAAGFVVPGVPAGLGVREVVMTAALGERLPTSSALAVVISTRAVWTLVQLAWAGVAVAYLARDRSRLQVSGR
jgi:glycosyltransferase 2 family protein